MTPIVTLTLNPSVDGGAVAEVVHPIRKIRTSNERYDPGGGGINVARSRSGTRGSSTRNLSLRRRYRPRSRRSACGRQNPEPPHRDRRAHAHQPCCYERSSGLEYRFVPEGPTVRSEEWRACLDALQDLDCAFLVASGSLPPGVPETFYAEVVAIAARKGAKFVLDTSGAALRVTLSAAFT